MNVPLLSRKQPWYVEPEGAFGTAVDCVDAEAAERAPSFALLSKRACTSSVQTPRYSNMATTTLRVEVRRSRRIVTMRGLRGKGFLFISFLSVLRLFIG